MFQSIPASDIVNILPSALAAGGSELSLNTVVFTAASKFPIKQYFDLDTVRDDFGSTSNEYKFAETYLQGFSGSTIKPYSVFFAEYVNANKAATLIGLSLRSTTLEQLKLVNGTLNVTIDGTLKTGTVNLSTATSFSDAATLIATALTAVVTFDTQLQSFVIASGTTGETSSISFGSGTAADALGLSEVGGAIVNNNTVADTADSALERVTDETLNFAPITGLGFDLDWFKDLAMWVTKQNHRFWLFQYGKEPTATIANSTANFAAWLKENDVADVTPIYGDIEHAAFACGSVASIDFSEVNGRVTLDFRSQSGIKASVTSKQDAKALEANGYAFYGAWATANDRFQFMRNSIVTGEFAWANTYAFQIWLNQGFQLDGIIGLQQYKSIPPNNEGKSLYRAIFQDRINNGKAFGGIVAGMKLTEQQKSVINRETNSQSAASQVELTGWYMYVGDAVNVQGAARKRFPAKFFYSDGGSIQGINMTSTAVL